MKERRGGRHKRLAKVVVAKELQGQRERKVMAEEDEDEERAQNKD